MPPSCLRAHLQHLLSAHRSGYREVFNVYMFPVAHKWLEEQPEGYAQDDKLLLGARTLEDCSLHVSSRFACARTASTFGVVNCKAARVRPAQQH